MRRFLTIVGILACAALPLAVQAPADAAAPTAPQPPVCRTTTTHLEHQPVTGPHGIWAYADIQRTTRICETGLAIHVGVDTPVLGVNADVRTPLLARYHATVTDLGVFTTVGGHSPGRGVDLCRGCTGHLAGGFTGDFTADAGFHLFADLLDGRTIALPVANDGWLARVWGGADIHLEIAVGGWRWAYWTCGERLPEAAVAVRAELEGLLWVNAEVGVRGDIVSCTCPRPTHSPSPSPSHSPSPSPSASVSASPSASVSPTPSQTGGVQGGVGGGTTPTPGGDVAVVQPVKASSSLPVTGVNVWYIAAAGLVFVAVGGAVILLTRRRRFTA